MTVPIEEFPPGMPFTCHVTAGFEAFWIVTVNCRLAPAEICADGGEMLSEIDSVGSTFGVPELPAPPLHEICCVIAINASHRAMERILKREERLRTSRHGREARGPAGLEHADIKRELRGRS